MVSLDWLSDMASRWRRAATPPLVWGGVLAVLSLIVALAAHISYLVAEPGIEQAHADIWFRVADVLVISAVGVLVLGRMGLEGQKTPPHEDDLRVAAGLSTLTMVFAFVGLLLGLDDRVDAADSWFSYAEIWAFASLGWLLVSRPVPSPRGGAIGGGLLAISGLFTLIGLATGMSDSPEDYVTGSSWTGFGIRTAVVGLGWLFGLRPREAS